MSTWNFNDESNTPVSSADPTTGLKAGNQPYFEADNLESKRNVIATDKGWVRRTIKKTDGAAPRIIDEVLVAAHPGGSTSYTGSGYLGAPDIAQIYMESNQLTDGEDSQVFVVFNEPVKHAVSSADITLAVANTAGGVSTLSATHTNGNSNTSIVNANNTLVFNLPLAGSQQGTYKIEAQTLGGSPDLTSHNADGTAANLAVTGAVSNTFGTFTVV